ncbi:MAG: right-handed parallel beta-helix repeat-containing protein, partial [bacterium]|nr:right-handed parallel beta-helix repeat-containing protein [bacterium]
SERAIQAGIDYVARLGGGTVHVLPGTYTLRNSVFLRPGVRLLGSGLDSVLVKAPMVETTLAVDSDWFDQEITLTDASGFEVGDGVCLQIENVHHGGQDVLKRTLVARSGNRFKLDRALRENFWTLKEPSVSSLFPLLTAEETTDFVVESITLDGNRENNGHLNGNYAGGIWLQDCSRVAIRKVVSRNNNTDAMSWQVCHDVLVEECHCHDNAGLGLHPGSGSQRPLMRGNTLERNKIGLFFCWGVKYGLAEKNTIRDSIDTGLSIGHRDNENLVRDNDITGSGKVGVLFRPERGEGFTARENRLENNRIVDNGPEDGAAVDVQGVTEDNALVRNTIRETRAPASRVGIRLGKDTGAIELEENSIEGFAKAVEDLREPGSSRGSAS